MRKMLFIALMLVQHTPATVVIDRDGVVRKVVSGTNQQKRDELLECVKSLMSD